MQALSARHYSEINVGFDIEYAEHLIEHFTVLRSHAHYGVCPGPHFRLPDNGRQLDGLGSRAENYQHPEFFFDSRHRLSFAPITGQGR